MLYSATKWLNAILSHLYGNVMYLHIENNDACTRSRWEMNNIILCGGKSNIVTNTTYTHLWLVVMYFSPIIQLLAFTTHTHQRRREFLLFFLGSTKQKNTWKCMYVCFSHVTTLYRFVNDDFMWFSCDTQQYILFFGCTWLFAWEFFLLVKAITQCNEVTCFQC